MYVADGFLRGPVPIAVLALCVAGRPALASAIDERIVMHNPCLRIATWRDALPLLNEDLYAIFPKRLKKASEVAAALEQLYDAEWRKRGFPQSP
jgi:hypothetical protein